MRAQPLQEAVLGARRQQLLAARVRLVAHVTQHVGYVTCHGVARLAAQQHVHVLAAADETNK